MKNKLRKTFKKILDIFWHNLALLLLLFLIIDILAGLLFFWVFFVNREAELSAIPVPTRINETLLNDFFLARQAREEIFSQALSKEHFDPFGGSVYFSPDPE